jgi:outer membrane protein assembly factor BamD (BamD/ComL family)
MCAFAPVILCMMTGCASLPGGMGGLFQNKDKDAKADGPKDSIVLTGGRGLEPAVVDSELRKELDAAKRLFDEKKYAQAEPLFHKLVIFHAEPNWWEFGLLAPKADDGLDASDGKKSKHGGKDKTHRRSGDPICEAAIFYEAECQRLQKNYRNSVDTYTKLLVEFTNSEYTNRACQGLFEIADHWLEPTRRQMDEYQEQLQGKRWMVKPALYMHWDKDMPLLDAEGHATIILNTIRLHNIKGPMAEKALLYLGTINFFRKEYKEADFYFTQLYQDHPNSDNAAKAIKQSVICKQLSTGGSVYDLRPVEESKKLLMQMQGAYPDLARDREWIEKQLISMNLQQADRDFKIAEFYQRTGHPGSAYFYFELVIRRYPGTDYASKATQRKDELKSKADHEQKTQATPPATASPPQLQGPAPVLNNAPRILPPGLEPGRDK